MEKQQIREALKEFCLKISGGCDIQSDGWPCSTCLCFSLGELVDEKADEYQEHNDPPDRINEVWRFILQAREL